MGASVWIVRLQEGSTWSLGEIPSVPSHKPARYLDDQFPLTVLSGAGLVTGKVAHLGVFLSSLSILVGFLKPRWLVGWSVGRSVGRLVGWLVVSLIL